MRQILSKLSIVFVILWLSALLSVSIWAVYKLPLPIRDEQSNVGIKFSEERALHDLRFEKLFQI